MEEKNNLYESKKVLDKGFVRLVDYMGDDARIVQSARVSYGAGTKTLREDRGLIRYLLRNAHTSPFEQVVFSFHIKMPIFVARQWVRHRTARLNEISARYSVMEDEFYVPPGVDINAQSENNKQARANEPLPKEIQEKTIQTLVDNQNHSYAAYKSMLDDEVAREIARISLPTSLYTEMYWQIDLHNLFHFLRLRLDAHAQKEIRDYAKVMYDIVKIVCPLASEAFEEYVQHKVEFYKTEQNLLAKLLETCSFSDEQVLQMAESVGMSSPREQAMVLGKIKKLLQK